MINETSKLRIKSDIMPFLDGLIEQLPQYGEIRLQVKICDYKAGTTTTVIKTAKKTPKT